MAVDTQDDGKVDKQRMDKFKALGFRDQIDYLSKMFVEEIVTPMKEANEKLENDEAEFEKEKEAHRDTTAKPEDIIKLDIGGKIFDIQRRILCRVPGTKLEALFNGNFKIEKCAKTNATFIDRDPTHFHIIEAFMAEKPYKDLFPTNPIEQKRFQNELKWHQVKDLATEFDQWMEQNKKR
eukprot:TRINITY_DN74017_c0_g1_i1.p1 TRINITY_DN74017_c0_g1~~TRINITY_DN74017_c0_g1_i1.p1  ORF type:complete len:180 (+),score=34.96 TRINITY_DN74017_c0_g1_i1:38-577(+)